MIAQRNLIEIYPALTNFRNFGRIDGVNVYDPHGFNAGTVQLGVVANVSTAPYLPDCRVIMQVAAIGAMLLRIEQSITLRAQLQLAEAEAALAIALASDKEEARVWR